MSTSPKTAGQQTNCNECPANSLYSYPPSITLNPAVTMHFVCSKATRLISEEIAKLQREDQCFYCKEVEDHWPWCSKEWQPMIVLTNSAALAWVNISEMTVPQPDHVEVENKWPPQNLLWAVRSHCWSLHQVYRAICLSMRLLWLRVA